MFKVLCSVLLYPYCLFYIVYVTPMLCELICTHVVGIAQLCAHVYSSECIPSGVEVTKSSPNRTTTAPTTTSCVQHLHATNRHHQCRLIYILYYHVVCEWNFSIVLVAMKSSGCVGKSWVKHPVL